MCLPWLRGMIPFRFQTRLDKACDEGIHALPGWGFLDRIDRIGKTDSPSSTRTSSPRRRTEKKGPEQTLASLQAFLLCPPGMQADLHPCSSKSLRRTYQGGTYSSLVSRRDLARHLISPYALTCARDLEQEGEDPLRIAWGRWTGRPRRSQGRGEAGPGLGRTGKRRSVRGSPFSRHFREPYVAPRATSPGCGEESSTTPPQSCQSCQSCQRNSRSRGRWTMDGPPEPPQYGTGSSHTQDGLPALPPSG